MGEAGEQVRRRRRGAT
uniref:Uncharacterized protein n=1 Tax=Arundo donax TaxID=35708 RepID=A0A0A9AWI8_ARUDO